MPNPEQMVENTEEPGVLTGEESARLKVIHKNLGHPSNAVLKRMLSEAQALPKFIEAAGKFSCDICKKQAQRKPVLSGNPTHSQEQVGGDQLRHFLVEESIHE